MIATEREKLTLTTETLLIEQYKTLRQEILKRTEIQYQVIGLGLIVLGTILTIGLGQNSALIILVYPLLALFLASMWSQNDILIRQIREYIVASVEEETPLQTRAWESYRKSIQSKVGTISVLRSSRRTLVGMQIIAILIAVFLMWSNTPVSPIEIALLALDLVVVIVTLIFLARRDVEGGNFNRDSILKPDSA